MQAFDPEADRWGIGPDRLVLDGPPGTGKTRAALDHFVGPALRQCEYGRVLACSFSNAAANELRDRLCLKLKLSREALREACSTIHSEALRRVRISRPEIKLYDAETDTVKGFRRETVPDQAETGKTTEAAIQAWDMARGLLVHQDEKQLYRLCCECANRAGESAQAVRSRIDYFEKRKRETNSLDFTDMLLAASRLPGRGLDLLLVDEAQDMTPLQWLLVDRWAAGAARVVIIGDGDQCIHEWMGASYRLFLERVRSWPVRVLAQSWRVPIAVHAAARSVITLVNDREDAAYLPTDNPGSVDVVGWDQVTAAAHELAEQSINAEVDPEWDGVGEPPVINARSMFILCRTNRQVGQLRKALQAAAVPFSFAPASAVRVRAIVELCRDGASNAYAVRMMLAKLPARAWFHGCTKKAALERLGETDLDTLRIEDLPFLDPSQWRPENESELLKALKIPGDAAYWLTVSRKYPTWMLTDPPQIEVMTWHKSKGRECDIVAIDARRPFATFGDAGTTDEELRCMYVALTRTRDQALIFGFDGSPCYSLLRRAVKAADLGAVVF